MNFSPSFSKQFTLIDIRKYFSILKICIYFAILKIDFSKGGKWGFLSFGKVKGNKRVFEVPNFGMYVFIRTNSSNR